MTLFTPRDRRVVALTLLASLATLIISVLVEQHGIYQSLMPVTVLLWHVLAFDTTDETELSDAFYNGALATLGSLYVGVLGEGIVFEGHVITDLAVALTGFITVVSIVQFSLTLLLRPGGDTQ